MRRGKSVVQSKLVSDPQALSQPRTELPFVDTKAYTPSCADDNRWVWPLAPVENWLGVRVKAGEMAYLVDWVAV